MPSFYHPDYERYYFGPEHPFSPTRNKMLVSLLDAWGVTDDIREAPPAPEDALASVHDEGFLDAVRKASARRAKASTLRKHGLHPGDTPAFEGMHEATRLMVGGTLAAAQEVAGGKSHFAMQLGGGLHHAHRDRAAGFCVYNDLAVAIRHFLDSGLRVAYVDVDVHHGDGVQSIFYDHPEVLTISLHESGRYLYPGTGFTHETGEGAGEGFKLNVPLAPQTGDASYVDALERVVPEAFAHFNPDVLVAQCGTDAHFMDPLAHLSLSSRGYEKVFRLMSSYAKEFCETGAIFAYGGGYNLNATPRMWAMLYLIVYELELKEELPAGWIARWEDELGQSLHATLHDENVPDDNEEATTENKKTVDEVLEKTVARW